MSFNDSGVSGASVQGRHIPGRSGGGGGGGGDGGGDGGGGNGGGGGAGGPGGGGGGAVATITASVSPGSLIISHLRASCSCSATCQVASKV